MTFDIRMGVPEMETLWNDLSARYLSKKLDRSEKKFFQKLLKTLDLLRHNPRHNGLQTHEISSLSDRYGMKIFQSYLENQTPAAGRIFWTYGPGKAEITILAVEPHPERKGYEKVRLSTIPKSSG
ncbi:MAG: hypothetical protein ABI778_02540 [Ignavibacteriota bacterium]